jgi:hypothetical protein
MNLKFAMSKETITRLERLRVTLAKQDRLMQLFVEYVESFEEDARNDMLQLTRLVGEMPNDRFLALLAERRGLIAHLDVMKQGFVHRPGNPAGNVTNQEQLV